MLFGTPRMFISYSTENLEVVREIRSILEAEGWDLWIDIEEVTLDSEVSEEIRQAIVSETSFVLLLWSKTAASSEWVRREILLAGKNLVVAQLDDEPLTEGFKSRRAADLSSWVASSNAEVMNTFLRELALKVPLPTTSEVRNHSQGRLADRIGQISAGEWALPSAIESLEQASDLCCLFSNVIPADLFSQRETALYDLLGWIWRDHSGITTLYGHAGVGKSSLLVSLLILASHLKDLKPQGASHSATEDREILPFLLDLRDYSRRFDPPAAAQRDLLGLQQVVGQLLETHPRLTFLIGVDGFEEFIDGNDEVENVFIEMLPVLAKDPNCRVVTAVSPGVELLHPEDAEQLSLRKIHFRNIEEHRVVLERLDAKVRDRGIEAETDQYVEDFLRCSLRSPDRSEQSSKTTLRFKETLTDFKPHYIDLRTLSLTLSRQKSFPGAQSSSEFFYQFLGRRIIPGTAKPQEIEHEINSLSDRTYRYFIELQRQPGRETLRGWRFAHYHADLRDYLIANKIASELRAGQDDRAAITVVYNSNITRHSKQILLRSRTSQKTLLAVAREIFASQRYYAIANVCYFLGRIRLEDLKDQALQLLHDQKSRLEKRLREQPGDDGILLALRTIFVSLINCGDGHVLEAYVDRLISDASWNRLNRAFHLEYYHDQPLPRAEDSRHEDREGPFPRTFRRLYDNIERHLGKREVRQILDLEVFTLYNLAQIRHARGNLDPEVRRRLVELGGKLSSPDSLLIQNRRVVAYLDLAIEHLSTPHFSLSDFARTVLPIKKTLRTGWVRRGLEQPESVASHMYGAYMLGLLLLPEDETTRDALDMVLIHDLAEATTGDLVGKNEKQLREENEWFERFAGWSVYPEIPGAARIRRLWRRYEEHRSDDESAQLARDLDQLDCLAQLHHYQEQLLAEGKPGIEDFDPWRSEIWRRLRSTRGKEIFRLISDRAPREGDGPGAA